MLKNGRNIHSLVMFCWFPIKIWAVSLLQTKKQSNEKNYSSITIINIVIIL